MMRKTMVVAAVVVAVAAFRVGASAQAVPAPATQSAQAPAVPAQPAQADAPATQAPSAASLLHPSPVGAELLTAPARADAPERPMVHAPAYGRRNGLALMIAGGAAFLGGAIIGGDAGTALMVGGVIVGAVGLYQYLQ